MQKIDAHIHFWNFDPQRDGWITDEMSVLKQNFLPEQIIPVWESFDITGGVAVQSLHTEDDTQFLLELAKAHPQIKGVVGWTDLSSDFVEGRLEYYSGFDRLKGFRHLLQGELNEQYMLQPDFVRGVKLLSKYSYTYDLLLYPNHLKHAASLVRQLPDNKFVLDHLGKPHIKDHQIRDWEKDINELAKAENVFCKISGLVTEADWNGWQQEDFTPYLDIVFNAFGAERVMFGSDHPMCKLAGGFDKMMNMIERYTAQLTEKEQQQFWFSNASDFYNLT